MQNIEVLSSSNWNAIINPLDDIVEMIDSKRNAKNTSSAQLMLYTDILKKINETKSNFIHYLTNEKPIQQLTEKAQKVETKSYSQILVKSGIASVKNKMAQKVESIIDKELCNKNLEANIISSFPTKKGDVIVKFNKDCNIDEIAKQINGIENDQVKSKVTVSRLMIPKMTVKDLPEHLDLTNKQSIIELIQEKNNFIKLLISQGELFEILFSFSTKFGQSAVIKCSPLIRASIIENGNYLKVGSKICKTLDRFHVAICSSCCKIGHSKAQCKSEKIACTFCSLDHSYKQCPNKSNPEKHECLNCKNTKETNDYHHSCFSKQCPSMKKVQDIIKKKTDHSLKA